MSAIKDTVCLNYPFHHFRKALHPTPSFQADMKITIVLACVLLFQMVRYGHCGDKDYDDVVDLSERQYDCQYMWMMMNNGAQLTAISSCLLLLLAIGTAFFSSS